MAVTKYQGGQWVDTGELKVHAFLLESSEPILRNAVLDATRVAAQRIQATARQQFAGTRHWKGYPRTISYDTHAAGPNVFAEVGPTMGKGTQGSFGHWLEYGNAVSGGPIKPHLGVALDANQEPFVADLQAAAQQTLESTIPTMGGLVQKRTPKQIKGSG